MAYWGQELIINATGCDKKAMQDYLVVYDFIKELVPAIDMVAYGEPDIVHFGEGNKEGFTLTQLIMTSNITAHFANESGDIFLNVFSCKSFDNDIVLEVLYDYFGYTKAQVLPLYRGTGASTPMLPPTEVIYNYKDLHNGN